MTCKDCIHYEACCNWTEEEHGAMEIMTAEDGCDYFQDKSKFIEVPCKVGDTVYFINDFIKEDPVINVLIIDALHITSGKNKLGNKKPSFALARDKIMNFLSKRLPFESFGKTVFLTPEEAKKALKERENNA